MSEAIPDPDKYALKAAALNEISAPELNYRPPRPQHYSPRIGLIGAGGIAASHLDAYRTAGWDITAIANRSVAKAQARADEYFPEARVTDRYEDIVADPSIEVVDITLHPADRLPIMEAALKAGKHVLSQKPFVLDLEVGERLVDLARQRGVKLAINQNGRWAPHLAWMREAVKAGLIGDVTAAHIAIHWDHGWIAGTSFENMEDVILFDFGIHWFDFLTSIIGQRAESVFATASKGKGQIVQVPLLAQALLQLKDGQASLVFDGATVAGPRDSTYIAGTKGSLRSEGPDLGQQRVTLTTAKGWAQPKLEGTWFNDGFQGAMGALLVAIEEDVEPENSAARNLQSLALAFAAIESRRSGRTVRVGATTRIAV